VMVGIGDSSTSRAPSPAPQNRSATLILRAIQRAPKYEMAAISRRIRRFQVETVPGEIEMRIRRIC
jgi:hypothetical protein